MNYTPLVLFGLGLLGVLLHNLVKMDQINRKYDGLLNFRKYFMLERFSITISVCIVIVGLLIRSEVKQLESVGKWLGVSFFTLGYMAQSILAAYMGKAEKTVNDNSKP